MAFASASVRASSGKAVLSSPNSAPSPSSTTARGSKGASSAVSTPSSAPSYSAVCPPKGSCWIVVLISLRSVVKGRRTFAVLSNVTMETALSAVSWSTKTCAASCVAWMGVPAMLLLVSMTSTTATSRRAEVTLSTDVMLITSAGSPAMLKFAICISGTGSPLARSTRAVTTTSGKFDVSTSRISRTASSVCKAGVPLATGTPSPTANNTEAMSATITSIRRFKITLSGCECALLHERRTF